MDMINREFLNSKTLVLMLTKVEMLLLSQMSVREPLELTIAILNTLPMIRRPGVVPERRSSVSEDASKLLRHNAEDSVKRIMEKLINVDAPTPSLFKASPTNVLKLQKFVAAQLIAVRKDAIDADATLHASDTPHSRKN